MKVFATITKVDAVLRKVWGRITEETVDKSDEILDYEGSKPYFQKWSEGIAKASGGKSVGNVRLMHQPVIAGKLDSIDFDDAQKAIDCCASVLTDEAWALVEAGAITGFSMGGKYVKRWSDAAIKGATRFIADPSEVSLVDNPCVPTATFTLIKADGTSVQKHFAAHDGGTEAAMPYEPTVEEVFKRAGELAGEGAALSDEIMDKAKSALIEEHAEKAAKDKGKKKPDDSTTDDQSGDDKAEAAGADGEQTDGNADADKNAALESEKSVQVEDWGIVQVFQVNADGSVHKTKADAKAHVAASKTLLAGNTPMAAALLEAIAKAKDTSKKPYGDVEYADPGYQDDKKKRYPLDTAMHVRAAWNYINKPKNADKYSEEQLKEIKGKIIVAWKDKIDADGPPSAEKMAAFSDPARVAKMAAMIAEKVGDPILQKGLWTVSRLAAQLEDFQWLVDSVAWEEEWENDADSVLPAQGAAILHSMATFLVEMATEETAEMLADMQSRDIPFDMLEAEPDDDMEVYEAAARAVELVKADEALIQKKGARHSKADAAKLQGIHDHAVAMGAKCSKEAGAGDDMNKADGGELKKLADENAALKDAFEKAMPEITAMGDNLKKLTGELEATKAELARVSALPAPMPAIAPGTRAVGKAEEANAQQIDPAEAVRTLLKHYGADKIRDMMMDAALSNPVPATLRGS